MKNVLKPRSFFVFYTQNWKKDTFFKFHSLLWKPEKSASFSHKRPDIFSICLRYKVNQLSWVIYLYLPNRKKGERRNFSSFFSFLPFYTTSKKVDFFCLSLFRLFGGQLSNKGGNNQWSVPAILLFTKNADYKNEKCLKIKVFMCILHSKLKKRTLFLTFTRRFENLRKVPSFLKKRRIFLGFVFDIKWTNFLE